MLKRILVEVGGSDYSYTAIQQAVELAKKHQAELTALSVFDVQALTDVGPVNVASSDYVQDIARDRMERAKLEQSLGLKEFTCMCDEAAIEYEIHKENDNPMKAIEDQSRYHDLLVIGLKGFFEFDIIADPMDLLIKMVQAGVRPILAVDKQKRDINKVLIAYSGSMESAKTMKHFCQLALWPNAEVKVICFDDGKHLAQKLVDEAVNYCRSHGLQASGEVPHGRPIDQLLPYADTWNADLIVLGNSIRSLWLKQIFGETALHVIRNANRPIFLSQ